jgi:hypothetical protein
MVRQEPSGLHWEVVQGLQTGINKEGRWCLMSLQTDFTTQQKKAIRQFIIQHNLEDLTDEEMQELIDAVQNPDDYMGVK